MLTCGFRWWALRYSPSTRLSWWRASTRTSASPKRSTGWISRRTRKACRNWSAIWSRAAPAARPRARWKAPGRRSVILWAATTTMRSGSPHTGTAAERIDMSSAPPDTQSSTGAGQQTGYYVYGILPGDVELTEEITGVGDREVTLVRDGELAALVSEVELIGPLGTT